MRALALRYVLSEWRGLHRLRERTAGSSVESRQGRLEISQDAILGVFVLHAAIAA
jgi:hypothetical protein